MHRETRRYWLLFFVLILIIFNITIYYYVWRSSNRGLTVAMLDVGQGDAILIESPTGSQVLFDSGPPRRIMERLPKLMPYFDKKIDAIIVTNPDADHIGGLADVLRSYKVGQVLEPGTWNESETYKNLKQKIQDKKIPNTLARDGMRIDMGGGVFIDVLFPDRDVSSWTTNDGSVVARLSYGETSIMLTGDATAETERVILENEADQNLDSDILKVGHHGSRTSTSSEFLSKVSPEYALISLGKDNKYGHPHSEVLDRLNEFGVKVLRTDENGTIILKSDGQNFDFSFKK